MAGPRHGLDGQLPRLATAIGFTPAAVIFDMDGVLADTESINESATAAVLARRGASLTRVEFQNFAGMSSDLCWAWMIDHLRLVDTAETLQREYVRELMPRLTTDLAPSSGAVDLVEELRACGLCLGIASSSPRRIVDLVLDKLGLAHAFAAVVSGEDVAAGKPAPDIFLLAAARLRAQPADCLVIEDSPHGLDAARQAGMSTVAVRTAYIPSSLLRADLIVDSIEQLAWGRSKAAGK